MKKNISQFLKTFLFILFIGFLAVIQTSFINWFNVFGVKINLVLIGILANIFHPNWSLILGGAILGGLIYDFTSFFNFSCVLSFLILVILFRVVGRKYLVEKHLFLNLFFGILGTIVFNFFYVLINYLFFKYKFFDYFLSQQHLVEIGLNSLGVFLFALIREAFVLISHLLKKK